MKLIKSLVFFLASILAGRTNKSPQLTDPVILSPNEIPIGFNCPKERVCLLKFNSLLLLKYLFLEELT